MTQRLRVTLGAPCPACAHQDAVNRRVNAIRRPHIHASSRRDPTRTTALRRSFVAQINRRFGRLRRDIRISIVNNDCFGLENTLATLSPAEARQFAFTRTIDKVDNFMRWLEEQENLYILTKGEEGLRAFVRPGTRFGVEGAWTDLYIERAYAQGVTRGRQELKRAGYNVQTVEEDTRTVAALMNQPFHADRLGVLYTRTFEDLKSVTQFMNARIRRSISQGLTAGLTQGIAEGLSPRRIARNLYNDVANHVDKIGITRARMIARTEIIRAHHVANVQEYRQASADMEVEIQAEWSTAGDDLVCPICAGYEGTKYSLDGIEDMLPAHPNCRCVAIPVPVEGQRRSRR